MAENIYKKLANIQKVLFVPKNQNNSFGHYSYRSCEDILVKVKPLCEEQGLVLTLHDSIECMANGDCYLKARAEIFDTGNGESIYCEGWAREAQTQGGMVPAQITGASSSYARKYALNGLFAIDNTKDPDTDEYQKKLRETPVTEENPSTVTADKKDELDLVVKTNIDSCKSKAELTAYMQSIKSLPNYSVARTYAGTVLNKLP